VPGRFVSFIYNMSGAIVRWYRDTFAAAEHAAAAAAGTDVYDRLFAELPDAPSLVSVLPHWSPMGPPDFITGSSGVIAGLTLGTRRGEILKGILQAAVFSVKDCLDLLPRAGIRVDEYRAAGGGSRSGAWIQLCADILGRPVTKPRVTEAGALGAAMLAGIGAGIFASAEQACAAMVRVERTFPPDAARAEEYARLYARHCRLWPLLREYLTGEPSDHGAGK
jgi:xylulokinase